MSELDLLSRSPGKEFARFSTMQWLADATHGVVDTMPLTTSQREHLLQLVTERMREQTGATGAAVALEQSGEMVCRASTGETAPDIGTPLRLEGSFTGRCIQSGAALRCDDTDSDPRVNPEACQVLGIRSMLVVPIRAHDHIMGVVEVLSDQPRAFTNAHQTSLEAIAKVIGESFFPDLPKPIDEFQSEPEHFSEVHQSKPAAAVHYDDGTWGESAELEEEAPAPTIFAGLHIRRPEIRKSAVVAFAAITFAACVGTIMLSRFPRQIVSSSSVPKVQKETVVPQPALISSQPISAAVGSTASTPKSEPAATIPAAPKKRAAQWEDEVVTRPAQKIQANARPVSPPVEESPSTEAPAPLERAQIIGDPIYRVDPVYPQRAIDAHMEGTVVLSAIVDKQGKVQSVSVISGDPIFRGPAINAVMHWRYNPTVINGQPTEAETQVTLDFVLSR